MNGKSSPVQSEPLRSIFKLLLLLPYEPAAFMQADLVLLQRHFDVDVVVHNRGKTRLALGMLRRLILDRPDVLVMWFIVPSYALAFTMLAKLLGVRVAFITGGYDIVSMPSIEFGAMRFPLFRLLIKPTLWLADLTLLFSKSAEHQVRKYVRPRASKVLYPGVDTDFFTPGPPKEREPIAVTVSPITRTSIRQKGLDTFVEGARYAPEMRFVLVGKSPDGSIESLRRLAPPNVEFIDRFLPVEDLRDLYRRASCYVQASAHEGFGVAVAEAMACGAVPITTKRFSLSEVTGGLGEYVPFGDPGAAASAAIRSITVSLQQREQVRAHIAQRYTPQRREKELVSELLHLRSDRRSLGDSQDYAPPVKLDLGCGSMQKLGYIGIDARPTRATSIVADVQALPIGDNVADEVLATCLLEHLDAPSNVLNEIHRVLKPTGRAIFRLPNLGTYSAHLDTTHRFLADLALWRSLLAGYFKHVQVRPVGTKYRANRSLVAINWLLVNLLKWYEFAQGWDFVCTSPQPEPMLSYIGWWQESEHAGRTAGYLQFAEH